MARLVDVAVGGAVFVAVVQVVSAVSGPSPHGTGVMIIAIVATFSLCFVAEVAVVAVWGRTLGKRLTGLAVVRADGGGPPGVWRSFLRCLLPGALLVAFFPLYPAPYAAAALTHDHRGPHDRLAGTRVVRRARRPVSPA